VSALQESLAAKLAAHKCEDVAQLLEREERMARQRAKAIVEIAPAEFTKLTKEADANRDCAQRVRALCHTLIADAERLTRFTT
jgi:uncharacterized protein YigA (DUF484 family)